jgi:hypothetical protein
MLFPRRSIKFTVVAVIQTFKNNECIRHCCVAWPQRIQIIPTCLHHYCESLQHSCMSVNGENRNWASRLKKKQLLFLDNTLYKITDSILMQYVVPDWMQESTPFQSSAFMRYHVFCDISCIREIDELLNLGMKHKRLRFHVILSVKTSFIK